MYLVGILLVLLGALLVKKITGQKYRKSFFIIELPEYKLPSLKRATVSMLERGKAYIKKAGTIILVCNTVVQIMQSFTWQFQLVEEGAEGTSILASIAHPFAILSIPLGFGVWQLAAAAITGFIAKENVVGTLAVVYGVTNLIDTDELALVGSGNEVAAVMGLTKVAALAYLMFNLYTPPCLCGSGRHELRNEERQMAVGRDLPPACHRIYGCLLCISDRYTDHHRFSGNGICSGTSGSHRICPDHHLAGAQV